MILLLSIVRVVKIKMPMHCQGNLSTLDDQSAASSVTPSITEDLKLHQQQDKVFFQLYEAILQNSKPPCAKQWSHSPLNRYRQLWPQLLIKDNLVCRQYTPGPTSEPLIVPIIPSAYQGYFTVSVS